MSALTRPKAGDRTSPWEAILATPLQVPAVNVSAADPWLPCLSVGPRPSSTTSLGPELPPPPGGSRSGSYQPQGQCPCDKPWSGTGRGPHPLLGRTGSPRSNSKGQKTREGWEEPLPTLWPWVSLFLFVTQVMGEGLVKASQGPNMQHASGLEVLLEFEFPLPPSTRASWGLP